VDHVDADGLGDVVSLGSQVMIRAYVSLGELSPEDVDVQVVFGRVDADDRIRQSDTMSMVPGERYDGNRWQYSLPISLSKNGPFGYTVRIVPQHQGLVSSVEMGLLAVPTTAASQGG
jgi:starch phosphorylase